MSSLSRLSDQYSPIALKLAKSRRVQGLTLGIGLFIALRRLNTWLSWRKANNGVRYSTWDAAKETVVVTGGSSGIGAAIVELLEERNIKVIVLDMNKPARKLGPRTAFYEIDLSDSDAITTVASRIRSQHGNPTVLVNNAGFFHGESLVSVTPEKLHRLFNVNLAAPFLLVREFLPEMVAANHGHIVNIGSMASFCAQALNVDYGATKAGVLALHEGILQELKHVHNAPAVRATVVHPTWVKTAMGEKLIGTGKLGAHVTAHDVASAVASQLTSGYGGQLIVPPTLGWTALVRGLPAWIQEPVRDAVTKQFVGALRETSL